MLTDKDCCPIIDNFKKKLAVKKPLQDLVVIMTTHAFAVILLVSEGSEQFKEHCAISGLVSALMLGSRSSRCRVVWPNLQS
jgi:hypothetical protein